jgi:hypothetical protein
MLFGSLGRHANTPRNCSCCLFSISVHITCCMTSTNPYGTACSSLLSEIRTSLFFGIHSLLRQMLSLFSAQPLSCSLLFSQQECCNFLVLGISPRISCSLNKTVAASSSLALGISPKSLLASHQDFFNFFFLSLGISPRASWHLTTSLFLSQQDCFHLPKNGCAHLP